MNNYQKKLVKLRPVHFQQGGYSTNISIGSPKPYTTQLPGVSFNPLTLNNSPVQVDTQGLTDKINRLQDLALKKQEMDFKYKELDYKKEKEYLDLVKDLYKGVESAGKTVDSLGGFGNIGALGEKTSDIERKRLKFNDDIIRSATTGNIKDLIRLTHERGLFETSPEVLEHKAQVSFVNSAYKSIMDGKLGVYGPNAASTALEWAMFGDNKEKGIDFKSVVNRFTEGLGFSTKSKDVDAFLNQLNPLFEPQEITEESPQNNGTILVTTRYAQKTADELLPALKNIISTSFAGKGFMEMINRSAVEQNVTSDDILKSLIDSRLQVYSKEPTSSYKGSLQKDVYYDPTTNQLRSIKEEEDDEGGGGSGKGKASEWQEKYKVGQESVANKYGSAFSNLPEVRQVILEAKDLDEMNERIDKIAKERGLDKYLTGGKSDVIEGTEVPNTLKGIQEKFNLEIDEAVTREIEKNGRRYLITGQSDVKDRLSRFKGKLNARSMDDEELREEFKLKEPLTPFASPDEPEYWNLSPFEEDATVYDLGPVKTEETMDFTFEWVDPLGMEHLDKIKPDTKQIGEILWKERGVKATSTFRTPERNSSNRVKGSPTSRHLTGEAIDYSWNEELFKELTEGELAAELESRGFKAYDHNPGKNTKYGKGRHIHIQKINDRLNSTINEDEDDAGEDQIEIPGSNMTIPAKQDSGIKGKSLYDIPGLEQYR